MPLVALVEVIQKAGGRNGHPFLFVKSIRYFISDADLEFAIMGYLWHTSGIKDIGISAVINISFFYGVSP